MRRLGNIPKWMRTGAVPFMTQETSMYLLMMFLCDGATIGSNAVLVTKGQFALELSFATVYVRCCLSSMNWPSQLYTTQPLFDYLFSKGPWIKVTNSWDALAVGAED